MLLLLTAAAFLGSNRSFTLIEDEVKIIVAARTPVAETIGRFVLGQGQHEHPPLSDILLHGWIAGGGRTLWLLRLPPVCFYLAGLVLLAACACKSGGPRAFSATLLAGCLWPFGFHFGRLVGWYSFCFFLTAAVLWTHLRYWERPSGWRFACLLMPATCLIYSNYYGWAVIGCLALDATVWQGRRGARWSAILLMCLSAAYLPMWRALLNELAVGVSGGRVHSLESHVVNTAAKIQSLLVSDAIAPWFWYFTIPIWVAIGGSLLAVWKLVDKRSRAVLVYFGLLFLGMAVLGILGTRRLLFVAGWPLIPYGVALASRARDRKAWAGLVACLMVLAATGWMGTVARRFYAATDMLEPWESVAGRVGALVGEGGAVVSNSPVFLFYLSYALPHGDSSAWWPGVIEDRRVGWMDDWRRVTATHPMRVTMVSGMHVAGAQDREAEEWLRARCRSVSLERLVPDSGYALKERFFPEFGQRQFRVELETFDCGAEGASRLTR